MATRFGWQGWNLRHWRIEWMTPHEYWYTCVFGPFYALIGRPAGDYDYCDDDQDDGA